MFYVFQQVVFFLDRTTVSMRQKQRKMSPTSQYLIPVRLPVVAVFVIIAKNKIPSLLKFLFTSWNTRKDLPHPSVVLAR